jgi:hypothetical protein
VVLVKYTKKAKTNIRPKFNSVSRRGSITNQPELVYQGVIKKRTPFSEYDRNRNIVLEVLIKKKGKFTIRLSITPLMLPMEPGIALKNNALNYRHYSICILFPKNIQRR